MEISERIGEQSEIYEEEVTGELVSRFAAAVGSEESQLAPPTLGTRWRRGEFELFERFGIPLQRVLHGDQTYDYHGPVVPGIRVAYLTRLSEAIVKRGRKTSLNFLTFETDVFVRTSDSSLTKLSDSPKVMTSRTTIVVRGEL